jgi:hypothetical protein
MQQKPHIHACVCNAGLFMALQPRIIACGNSLAAYAMAVRFLVGPAVMAAASLAVGLRGVLLHIAIVQVHRQLTHFLRQKRNAPMYAQRNESDQELRIVLNFQAALPQGIVPFVFAKEYNVHPNILSTAYDLLSHPIFVVPLSILAMENNLETVWHFCPVLFIFIIRRR